MNIAVSRICENNAKKLTDDNVCVTIILGSLLSIGARSIAFSLHREDPASTILWSLQSTPEPLTVRRIIPAPGIERGDRRVYSRFRVWKDVRWFGSPFVETYAGAR